MIFKYFQLITSQTSLTHQEAIWLLEHITQKKYIHILQNQLTPEELVQLNTYIDQINKEHKPLAYIIGWVPFLDLKISVKPPILIPRPETEEWVNSLISKISPHQDKIHKILEVGTGSGAISLALAKSLPKTEIWAIDINPNALDLASQNAQANNIKNILFLKSDLFQEITGQTFDLIVANPPYIPQSYFHTMSVSVTKWEDPKALFAKKQGIDILQQIIEQADKYLTKHPELPFQLVLEIDRSHNKIIKKITHNWGWQCEIKKDLFGNWRTIWCKRI